MDVTVKKIERAKVIKKKKITFKENRLLISINVVGSTGPIRFIVKADETVKNVIDNTLSCYGRQGRLPMVSSHCTSSFLLYCPYSPAQCETQSGAFFFHCLLQFNYFNVIILYMFQHWIHAPKSGQRDPGTLLCVRIQKLRTLKFLQTQPERLVESGGFG